MTDGKGFEQSGQNVQGPQINVGGNAGTVLSGQFKGPVYVDSSGAFSLPVPCQIPLPPLDFTGREDELQELQAAFNDGSSIIGLRGMGGVGKSALAFALAEKLRDRFPDGQLFISMIGTSPKPLTAAEAMAQVIRSYQPALRLPESEAELANLYRSLLGGKRALLLLDNALDDRQVRPLLRPAGCCLLITSRRKFNLQGMAVKDLDVLKINPAVDLLHKTAGAGFVGVPAQKKEAWKELARLCGCLPVALKAAGSFLANTPDSSPEKYARELQDEKKRLQRIGKEGVDEDVDLKLSLSYHHLDDETARVFRELSVFPYDFDAQAEEVICRDEAHRQLIELVRWSLVEYLRPETEGEGRYHLHDLVRIYASSQLEKDGEATLSMAHQRHASYYLAVLRKANELLLEGRESLISGLKLFDLERLNIQAGQAWAKSQSAANSEGSEICSNFAWQGSILNLRLHPQENIRWIEAALACARQLENQEAEGAHLGNLGLAYADLGDAKKAIEYYEQALTIAREIRDRRGEGNALGNLGNAYADLGDAKKAIEYYEQQLKITQEIGDRSGEANACWNLGLAYEEAGDLKRAADLMQVCVDFEREIGHPDAEKDADNIESVRAKLNKK